jgi:3',5'-cyclic AMP phosphodiesterase CpdA
MLAESKEEASTSLSRIPLRIAHLSDVHVGGPLSFDAEAIRSLAEQVCAVEPDVVVVAGDLTTDGYEWEFEEAARWLETIDFPKVVIPGNHDARNVGYLHFNDYFGDPYSRYRQAFDEARAERLQARGVTVVALDSSEPDINDGRVGQDRYSWIREQFDETEDVRILTVHHHLVPIPGTGRERNTVADAGDLLLFLTQLDLDVVLSGHKHVPFFWGLNGMLICNSGTAATRRLRGSTPPSWNELQIDASTVKVWIHYPDGRRELAVIFSRKTRALTRESFFLTDDFISSNRIFAA